MIKKILCGVLSLMLILSATTAFAAFPDVDGDSTVSWAKPYIDEMSSLGYIKGYEDGTFKPNKTISKVEALVLLSRMIGVNDEENEKTTEYALSEYKSVIEKYSAEYENEIAFLLYRGIIKESEIADYISVSNRSVALKRYEAAILLTKLLGGEAEVENMAFVSSSYSDALSIPEEARAYVEYVKENGIMQGMGNNEFSPNTGVTRSQMAKMLCTLIDALDVSYETGKIVSTDALNHSITVKINGANIDIPFVDATLVKINGEKASISDLDKNVDVRISYLNGDASLVENVVVIKDEVVKGIVSSVRTGATTVINLSKTDDLKEVTSYTVSKDVKVIVDGAIDSLSKIKTNSYVSLTIDDGMVVEIQSLEKSGTVSGVLKSIDYEDNSTIFEVEKANGDVEEYYASKDGVGVTRNSQESSIAQLIPGDNVSLRLTYGAVTKIYAESTSANSTGVIEYITHTVDGTRIGIKLNGSTKEYKVNKKATIIVDSLEAGVYDLRPGGDIKIKLESSEIVKIETTVVASNTQFTGTIKSINTTYGLLIVESAGVQYNVFTNGNTKIIDSATGNALSLKKLSVGDTAAITGTSATGVFEATVVVIQ